MHRKSGQITTIENYEKRFPLPVRIFRRAGKEDKITLIEGDATKYLQKWKGRLILFLWMPRKASIFTIFRNVLRLLSDGGCLVSDNVMQDGDIIESSFAVERRNRTIHARMREYLYELKHNEELVTSIIPLGDGVTVSIKK